MVVPGAAIRRGPVVIVVLSNGTDAVPEQPGNLPSVDEPRSARRLWAASTLEPRMRAARAARSPVGGGGSGEAGVVNGEGYLYPIVRVELGE
jgi:hypothetical protein